MAVAGIVMIPADTALAAARWTASAGVTVLRDVLAKLMINGLRAGQIGFAVVVRRILSWYHLPQETTEMNS